MEGRSPTRATWTQTSTWPGLMRTPLRSSSPIRLSHSRSFESVTLIRWSCRFGLVAGAGRDEEAAQGDGGGGRRPPRDAGQGREGDGLRPRSDFPPSPLSPPFHL